MNASVVVLLVATLSGAPVESQVLWPGGTDVRAPSADSVAVAVAEAWLPYLDAGDYAGAWERAGSFARANFPLSAWEEAMASARGRLGDLEARRLVDVALESALPGAPPGEYAVLVFESRFASWPLARERVTLMKEEDGSWGVLGYVVSGT